jgi:trehalose 6-phosphate phosphatase
LFLDLDGTLLEIAATPTGVAVGSDLRGLLAALRDRLDGAVALVSGRAIAQLDDILAPLRLCAAGQHGLEWRGADGAIRRHPAPAVPPGALARLRAFVADHPGTILEPKGASVAVHYRGRPEAGHATAAAVTALADADPGAWDVLHGKMVVELRPAGVHKGVAIERLMQDAPFAGRTPVFAGDDWTDEDGFTAVRERGGIAIAVGVDRRTRAGHGLPDVSAVHQWLADSAAALRRGRRPHA